jgi:hypothetical protein
MQIMGIPLESGWGEQPPLQKTAIIKEVHAV